MDRLLVGVDHCLEFLKDMLGGNVLVKFVGDDILIGQVNFDDFLDNPIDVARNNSSIFIQLPP